MYYIYALLHPEESTVLYIGQSNDPDKRYYQHCRNDDWIQAMDEPPNMWVVDKANNRAGIDELECYWIMMCALRGCPLENHSLGANSIRFYQSIGISSELIKQIIRVDSDRLHVPICEYIRRRKLYRNTGMVNTAEARADFVTWCVKRRKARGSDGIQ